MGKKKNEMKIMKNNSNKEGYTFVSDNIINNTKNNESINKGSKSESKPNDRMEKKIHSKKVDNKGRKILGKSM
jgi:hypothetical protein